MQGKVSAALPDVNINRQASARWRQAWGPCLRGGVKQSRRPCNPSAMPIDYFCASKNAILTPVRCSASRPQVPTPTLTSTRLRCPLDQSLLQFCPDGCKPAATVRAHATGTSGARTIHPCSSSGRHRLRQGVGCCCATAWDSGIARARAALVPPACPPCAGASVAAV